MSSTIEQIKEKLSIVDCLSSYITLEKSGASFKAKCPFHNEKTPSFFVSPDRNSYYCFGCGAKGDIFTFVEEFESLDFLGALKILAERTGVKLNTYKSKEEEKEKTLNQKLFEAMEEATVFFQNNLKENKEALIYLKKRALDIQMVNDWRLGYAPDEWRALKSYLLEKGFSPETLLKAGLIKNGEQGSYDRFRGRIIFPIFDGSGRTIAFTGRILKESEDKTHDAKYLNSPETPLFEKSKILYGMQKAKFAIKEKRFAILVEGQMDLLLSHQAGFPNTIASSGTSLTLEQITIVKRLTDSLVIAYDSDNAGQNASFKAWQLALSSGLEVKVASLPRGFDPAEAVKENPSLWRDAVEQAEHIVDYYIKILKQSAEKEADVLIKEKILPLIRSLESSIDQSRFVRKLSFDRGISENAIWEDLSKIEIVTENTGNVEKKLANKSDSLRKAISFLFYLEKKNPQEAAVFKQKLNDIISDTDSLILKKKGEEVELIFEAEMHYGNSPNDKASSEILYYLEEEILKEKLAKAISELKKGETEKDLKKNEINMKEVDDISKKFRELSKKYFN